jgi:hypothetical protein
MVRSLIGQIKLAATTTKLDGAGGASLLVGAGDPEHGAAAEHAAVQRLAVGRHRRGRPQLHSDAPQRRLRIRAGGIIVHDVVREAHPLLAPAPRLLPLHPPLL